MTWLVHLGMSGRFIIESPTAAAPRSATGAPAGRNAGGSFSDSHDHVVARLDDGSVVRYNDARRFGMMDLAPTAALDRHRLLTGLGPDPLGNGFNAEALNASLAGRRTPIKAALMDQRTVAGLGNIYVCESLYYAGISPRRRAATIPGRRAERLVAAIRQVLRAAIEAGGSSLRDYVQSTGELGYFQHRFAVYDREGVPCPDCRCTAGVRRIIQSGRSTFYCAKRQR